MPYVRNIFLSNNDTTETESVQESTIIKEAFTVKVERYRAENIRKIHTG
jgi:hypothetical protein